MPKLIILQGLPASGKSTIAKEIVSQTGNTKRVNKDDIRALLDNSKWNRNNEKFVLKTRNFLIEEALKDGFNVVCDDTNLHPKHVQTMKEIAKTTNSQVEVRFVDTPIEVCIERDLKRPNSVGEKVIKEMYNQFLKPEKVKYIENSTLEHVVLCDLDGTLALKGDRDIFDWMKVDVDIPNPSVIQIVNSLLMSGKTIIYMSGRSNVCQELTIEWIKNNVKYYSTKNKNKIEIYMRSAEDMRKDTVVKKELFEQNIKNKYYVDFCIDDRPSVCRMWRDELGLEVIQIGDPYVEF
ncbi:MAG: AAA family ATPase [Patescibacteria group bacterium]